MRSSVQSEGMEIVMQELTAIRQMLEALLIPQARQSARCAAGVLSALPVGSAERKAAIKKMNAEAVRGVKHAA